MRIGMRLSRESGMTQSILTTLLNAVEGGLPLRWSAATVGVPHGKLLKWLAQGREGIEPFDKLYDAVEKAQALAILEQLQHMQVAASDPARWNAAVKLLEWMDPDTFLKHDREDVTPLDVTIVIGGDRTNRTNDNED